MIMFKLLIKKFIRHWHTYGIISAIKKILSYLRYELHKNKNHFVYNSIFVRSNEQVKILTPLHTVYIAKLIQNALKLVNVQSTIITEEPYIYEDYLYFVIAPHVFITLPKKRVIFFQVEQSESKWMTTSYIKRLKKADLILDYSINNIEKLKSIGIHSSKILYLPIGLSTIEGLPDKRDIDILFYGDINSPRRKKFLAILQNKFSIKIIHNKFEEEMYSLLKRTKIVINIHYYNNALLETTRIYEALSHGCIIVSEKSVDYEQYSDLNELVDFIDIDDIDQMCTRIDYWLKHDHELKQKRNDIINHIKYTPNCFVYFFMRFLFYCSIIDFDTFYYKSFSHINLNSNKICLSLPEYKSRYESFRHNNDLNFEIFPGVRHHIPWIGCGISYKFLARYLLEKYKNLSYYIICEDDVDFSNNTKARLPVILEQLLKSSYHWDIFSGFIADFAHDTKILSIDTYKGETFIKINKMTSTVFMIYSTKALKILSSWQYDNVNINNTIDRFLQKREDLIIVTTKPFLVNHKEDLNSTLWKERNNKEMYSDMIELSQKELDTKIQNF